LTESKFSAIFMSLLANFGREAIKFKGRNNSLKIKFYGTRGSVPAPMTAEDVFKKAVAVAERAFRCKEKPQNVEDWVRNLDFQTRGTCGGNTTCCVVRCDDKTMILDMGTGLRQFGMEILPEMFQKKGFPINVFMSHVHWDHVQGFPFFSPLFISRAVLPNNKITFFGGTQWQRTLEEVLQGQMDAPVFPVEWEKVINEGPAMEFRTIYNGFETMIGSEDDPVFVKAARLNHPNETYGWRISWRGKVFVFATDTEPFPGGPDPVLVRLANGADVLYTDCQFSENQYLGREEGGGPPRLGWGHGYDTWCGEVAKASAVRKQLIIGHHDPAASDERIFQNLARVKSVFPNSLAAYDGMEISI
jgi:phosphoribosyl 1,2-cyclic phosphodiesterase